MVAVPGVVSIVWLGLLWMLVRRHVGTMLFLQLVLPSVAVCTVLLVDACRSGRGMSREKCVELIRDVSTLWLGAALPIACFLVPFMIGGGVDDLLRGVFVTPQLRLDHATLSFPPAACMILEIPVACLLALGLTRLGKQDFWLLLGVAPVLAILLWSASSDLVHQLVFMSARCVVPVIAVLAAWLLLRNAGHLSAARRQELFLLVAMMAFTSLVRFPFAGPIYFCYTAPLVGLALQFFLSSQPYAPRRVQLCSWCSVCFLPWAS